MINFTGCSIYEAVTRASYNPAKHLGLHDRIGSIGRGKDADLVVLSADYYVLLSMCKGEIACDNLEA